MVKKRANLIRRKCWGHLNVIQIQPIVEDDEQFIVFRYCPQWISAYFRKVTKNVSIDMSTSNKMQTTTWKQTKNTAHKSCRDDR